MSDIRRIIALDIEGRPPGLMYCLHDVDPAEEIKRSALPGRVLSWREVSLEEAMRIKAARPRNAPEPDRIAQLEAEVTRLKNTLTDLLNAARTGG
jgi:hypothetical protein